MSCLTPFPIQLHAKYEEMVRWQGSPLIFALSLSIFSIFLVRRFFTFKHSNTHTHTRRPSKSSTAKRETSSRQDMVTSTHHHHHHQLTLQAEYLSIALSPSLSATSQRVPTLHHLQMQQLLVAGHRRRQPMRSAHNSTSTHIIIIIIIISGSSSSSSTARCHSERSGGRHHRQVQVEEAQNDGVHDDHE